MVSEVFAHFVALRNRDDNESCFSKLHVDEISKLTQRAIIFLSLLFLCPGPLLAADKDEYRRIADSSFATVLRQSGATEEQEKWCLTSSPVCINKNLWMDKTFGRIASESVESDISSPRFHERGKTILEQLRPLDSAQVSIILASHVRQVSSGASSTLPKVEIRNGNVILSYLLHHVVALHLAKEASPGGAGGEVTLERALAYEAVAESYVIDAFASGHMLVPMSDGLSFLHPTNNKVAHDFYNVQGTYVLNSRGEVWQTFGDELLEWYAPTFRHIFEACCTSLREILLAYYGSVESGVIPNPLSAWGNSIAGDTPLKTVVDQWLSIRDAQEYYSSLKMPTLLLLPMPISATWSLRTEEVDSHEIHERKQYPQIKESSSDPGFHDPYMLDVDDEFIYTRSSLPNWMLPDAWIPPDSLHGGSLKEMSQDQRTRLAANLIRHDTTVASVRYMQERYYPPTYWGLLFRAGGGYFFSSAPSSAAWSAGLGYAPPLALIPDVPLPDRLSFDLTYMQLAEKNPRQFLSLTGGLSVGLYTHRSGTKKPFRYLEYLRLESGYVWGLSSPLKSRGAVLSFGLESGTIPLGFTYAGISVRLKYQLMLLKNSLHGVALEIVLL